MGRTHAPNSFLEITRYWEIAHFGGPLQVTGSSDHEAMMASLGIVPISGAEQAWRYDDILFYDGNW